MDWEEWEYHWCQLRVDHHDMMVQISHQNISVRIRNICIQMGTLEGHKVAHHLLIWDNVLFHHTPHNWWDKFHLSCTSTIQDIWEHHIWVLLHQMGNLKFHHILTDRECKMSCDIWKILGIYDGNRIADVGHWNVFHLLFSNHVYMCRHTSWKIYPHHLWYFQLVDYDYLCDLIWHLQALKLEYRLRWLLGNTWMYMRTGDKSNYENNQ